MKGKYFLIKLATVLAYFLVAGLYYLFYFVPAIKDISHSKRQLKDMNLKISDYLKAERTFQSFPNEEERGFFQAVRRGVESKTSRSPYP